MIPGAAFAASSRRASYLMAINPVIRLGVLFLGLFSCMLASPAILGIMLLALSVALMLTGMRIPILMKSLRPWLPMVLVILLIHTLTTTAAGPMGKPTWPGLLAGTRALARVACTVAWLALYSRSSSLDDLVGAVRWWFFPLEKIGFPGQNLGLVLAVALGTAPVVLGEGRRIETVVRLRRNGPRDPVLGLPRWSVASWSQRQFDRARVVVPLVEALGRRAEALSLSLRSRRPCADGQLLSRPPVVGLLALGIWLALLVTIAVDQGVS